MKICFYNTIMIRKTLLCLNLIITFFKLYMMTQGKIKQSVLDAFSRYETAYNEAMKHDDFFYIKFSNNTDEGYCFNQKHIECVAMVQKSIQEWYFGKYCKGFSSFQEWYDAEREKEEKGEPNELEKYWECEGENLNYSNGGHDNLENFYITFKINDCGNHFELEMGQDTQYYIHFPEHEPLVKVIIKKEDSEEVLEDAITKAINKVKN